MLSPAFNLLWVITHTIFGYGLILGILRSLGSWPSRDPRYGQDLDHLRIPDIRNPSIWGSLRSLGSGPLGSWPGSDMIWDRIWDDLGDLRSDLGLDWMKSTID